MMDKLNITAVILAGGKGRRFNGQDKGLIEFAGKPIIEHIIEAIKPQVNHILINANRNQEIYQQYGYPVIADSLEDFQGPLAGFAIAMQNSPTDYIITLPCDGPQVPADYVNRLTSALQQAHADIAVAHDGDRLQPVQALLPVKLFDSLMTFLNGGDRKIDLWYAQHQMALADFSDARQTFNNINTQADKERLLAETADDCYCN